MSAMGFINTRSLFTYIIYHLSKQSNIVKFSALQPERVLLRTHIVEYGEQGGTQAHHLSQGEHTGLS